MLNSVLLQLLLASNVFAPLPLDLHEAATISRLERAAQLPDSSSLLAYTRKGIRKPDQKKGEENDQNDDNDLKKQAPKSNPFDHKQVSDLLPDEPKPLGLLGVNREHSLHPEHNPSSPSYSGRDAPGPDHGPNPHGPDPHDEQGHEGQDGYPSSDPYNGSTTNDKDHPYRPYPR